MIRSDEVSLIPPALVLLTVVAMAIFVVTRGRTLGGKSNQNMEHRPESVTVRLLTLDGALTDPVTLPGILKTDEEWRTRLTPEQYAVARSKATERPFRGRYHDNYQRGVYTCVACGLPLFGSDAKFDSSTGWPSFSRPLTDENISKETDLSHGMVRSEVHCVRCGSHLGHVFTDGPAAPSGLRYCINSASLTFYKTDAKPGSETAIFGAGCFWGVEEAFSRLKGITSTEVGYSGGKTQNPTYEQVCSHTTGHAEVIKVEFDPSILSYARLLELFFEIHDPTSVDRQGFDIGDNYRSAIFFTNPVQEAVAQQTIAKLEQAGKYFRPIVTQVELAGPFYRAEEYHHHYAVKHGGGYCHLPSLR